MYPSILSFKTINKLSCSLNAVFLGLKMWDTFAFDCFDFKVRPGTPGLTNNPGLHRQSSLHRLLATAKKFIQLYSAIAVLATCPGCRVTEKATFPH
jgi:hypothetical protein